MNDRGKPMPSVGASTLSGASIDMRRIRDRLAEPRPLTLDDLLAEVDLDQDGLVRLLKAANRFREEGDYAERQREWVRLLVPLLAWVPLDFVERSIRQRTRALWSMAIADLQSVEQAPAVRDAVAAGMDPSELGDLIAAAGEQLLDILGRVVGQDYLQQFHVLLESDVVARVADDLGRDVDLSVGFIDLVGFTKLSAAVDPRGMHEVLDAFERLVADTASEVGDVIPTKTLGDAVMLTSATPDNLAEVLLHAVTAEVPALEHVARRAGMTHGEVHIREGDYVGTTVNTAARLTDLAYPGSLVISQDTWDAMDQDRWNTSLLPTKHLKGLGTAKPLRVRNRSD